MMPIPTGLWDFVGVDVCGLVIFKAASMGMPPYTHTVHTHTLTYTTHSEHTHCYHSLF